MTRRILLLAIGYATALFIGIVAMLNPTMLSTQPVQTEQAVGKFLFDIYNPDILVQSDTISAQDMAGYNEAFRVMRTSRGTSLWHVFAGEIGEIYSTRYEVIINDLWLDGAAAGVSHKGIRNIIIDQIEDLDSTKNFDRVRTYSDESKIRLPVYPDAASLQIKWPGLLLMFGAASLSIAPLVFLVGHFHYRLLSCS